ncbi:hypothetical protein ACHHYP_04172 [Achlya hypogyna]|uniref:Transmembrane protein n=1 Tax=Achlya hypogyna TaxID=1202772 RepID=A0A1V9Z205_ACHHY|nr:hypothetical protein ACHHYP_04172 [Achlya hypogyna]
MHRRKAKRDAPTARAFSVDEEPKAIDADGVSSTDPMLYALVAIVLGVYSQTLYPSVAGGDSGELLAESCHLGVSHPPGYPLYSMLNFAVMQLLPGGAMAWKANFFSAACDSLCVVLMYWTLLLWLPALDVGFAFSPLVWAYAVGAEVFSLNNLFAAALLFVLLRYARSGSWVTARLGACLCGLALTNQHTIVLFELPIIPWVLYTQRATLTAQRLVTLALCFFAGLLPYLYLPLVSYARPQPGSWGDVTSVAGFVHHLRRGDYGTFRLFSTDKETEGLSLRLQLYFADLVQRQGGYVLGPLALVGCGSSLVHGHHAVGALVLITFTVYVVGFHALANLPLNEGLLYGVHMRFWQQPNIIAFLWAGLGLGYLLGRVPSGALRRGVALASLLCVGVGQLHTWHHVSDQSQATYIAQYAKALLKPLPPNALLFVNYDLQWTAMRYLQRCENYRPDVTILNLSMMTYKWFATKRALYPKLTFPGSHLVPASLHVSAVVVQEGGFSLLQLLEANSKRYAKAGIFLGGQLNYKDADLLASYTFVPHGLLDKFHRVSKPVYKRLDKWHTQLTRQLATVHAELPALPPPDKYNDETWEWTVARDYHMKRLSIATFLLDETIKSNGSIAWLAESTKPMEHSLLHEPRQFWTDSLLKNLGLAYAYIVKSPESFAPDAVDVFPPHVGANVADATKYEAVTELSWKDRASARMLEVWHEWTSLPSAKLDPGYAAIHGIVAKFHP